MPSAPPERTKPAALAGSRWNNVFELDDRWLVVNSITMRAAVVDAELVGALACDGALPPSPAIEALARRGIVATADDDERRGLDAVNRRSWAGPILDLFAIGPIAAFEPSRARLIAQLRESITTAHASRSITTVKLRLCGASHAFVRRNAEILAATSALCRELGIALVSLVMGDALHDALACTDAVADAYFFRWRPVSAAHDRRALDAIRGLVVRGKLVAIQIAARDRHALRAHVGWMHELGGEAHVLDPPNPAWDVAIDDDQRPFFAASVCHRDPEQVRELAAMRSLLRDRGIPLRAAVAPFHHHPGCPLLSPQAHILLPTGRRARCLDDVATSGPGFDPRAASEARTAEQLERSCTRCSVLPFCLARCPKLPAPVPGSPACSAVKDATRAELRQLLQSGQIRPEYPGPRGQP